ncbi:ABC transporter substrate-binding protein [Rubellimicrobium aerolatum]|uniref:ABC transporter substrate-binding protein n=1 Tax=Rubellimicrobium aerolatum TaxID=490979 RepID=A0ABW0SAA6_9RHOB|nr:ABC transporter substrate-binding protein [Rubellimicrobium aerolatum]MBP1805186.1 peptide/nickel transport system substrate-binding protein [Rubellimicrobium aerolatum]
MSRRGLLGAGVLAGVLAASGVPLQARTRGGALRLGLAGSLPGRDWTRAPAVLAQGAVYETLTEIGPTGDLRGELAEAWEAAPGARVWHIALRPEARFHDGRPLGAEDVLASLARHRDGVLSGVEEIAPQGPLALRITLAEGDPDFPLRLADPRLVIGPEGRLDGTGSGLYRLAATSPDRLRPDRLRLDRVAAHPRDGRAGWFDAIEARSLPDPAQRLDALLAGEVDVVDPLPPDLLRVAQEAGLLATAVQGNRQLHARLPPDADPALAAVLPRALDRAALAEAWGGTPAADHPLGPLHPALAALPPPAFDPGAAAALAGHAPLLSAWGGRPTEDATFRLALAGPWGPLRDDPDLRAHLAAARATEGEARAAHYAAAQALCAARAPVAVVAHIPAVTLHSPALAHDAVSPLAPLDGGRIAKRWWFA